MKTPDESAAAGQGRPHDDTKSYNARQRFAEIRSVRDADHPPLTKLVLFVLLTYANEQGLVFPSVATIARGTHLSQSTVRTIFGKLAADGILVVDGDRSKGRRPTRYMLRINPPEYGELNPNPPAGDIQPTATQQPTHRITAFNPPAAGAHQLIEQPNEQLREHTPHARSGENHFDTFWNAYPRKRSKGTAAKAWKAKGCSKIADRILTAVRAASASPDWTKDGGKWIPYPASWINAEGWNDELPGAQAVPTEPGKVSASAWLRANPTEARQLIAAFRRQVPAFATCTDDALIATPPRELVEAVESAQPQTGGWLVRGAANALEAVYAQESSK